MNTLILLKRIRIIKRTSRPHDAWHELQRSGDCTRFHALEAFRGPNQVIKFDCICAANNAALLQIHHNGQVHPAFLLQGLIHQRRQLGPYVASQRQLVNH